MAGPAAEQRHADYPNDMLATLWETAWKPDRDNAAANLCQSRRVRTLADVETLAASLVEEHWAGIARIAEVLLDQGELSGARIEALFCTHS
jgi:hypothetical protein